MGYREGGLEQGTRSDPKGFQNGVRSKWERAKVWKRVRPTTWTEQGSPFLVLYQGTELWVETRMDQRRGTVKRAKHGRPRGMYFQNKPAA